MAFRLANVPNPHTVHPDTFHSGRHAYAVTSNDGVDAIVMFCPQHNTAAIYEPALGSWTIRTPTTFGAFLAALAERGVVIPDNEDSREWIEACGLSPVPEPRDVKH